MKICFITCIFSKNGILPTIQYTLKEIVNMTIIALNDESNKLDTSWDVIKIDTSKYNRVITESRYPKFMAWSFIKEAYKEYDVIYYCDGFYTPKETVNWDLLSTLILKSP